MSGPDATFKLQTTTLPELGPNQVLVKTLSVPLLATSP